MKPEVSAGVSLADNVFHQFLWIGTFMGVITLPIYTILLGTRLIREKSWEFVWAAIVFTDIDGYTALMGTFRIVSF